jgi:hypothetical protein
VTPRLRWTEAELRVRDERTYAGWRLVCLIVLNALKKNATIIFVKKTSPTKLAVLYAVDGRLVEEMLPPARLHLGLVALTMTLCGPLDVQAGARGELEIIREDGTLLLGHAICGSNEWGLTATIRLGPPPRVLN